MTKKKLLKSHGPDNDFLPSKLSLPKHYRSVFAIEANQPAMMQHSMKMTMEVFVNYYCSTYVAVYWIFPICHYHRLECSVKYEREKISSS